jgi:hypothetical protein
VLASQSEGLPIALLGMDYIKPVVVTIGEISSVIQKKWNQRISCRCPERGVALHSNSVIGNEMLRIIW